MNQSTTPTCELYPPKTLVIQNIALETCDFLLNPVANQSSPSLSLSLIFAIQDLGCHSNKNHGNAQVNNFLFE